MNIAARLESLADPGGICVSKTAFDQIETKLPFGYELPWGPSENLLKRSWVGYLARISQVVAKYEGFIEKFVGDAVMALFGATKAHEDDPVRAIKAAREIHEDCQRDKPCA